MPNGLKDHDMNSLLQRHLPGVGTFRRPRPHRLSDHYRLVCSALVLGTMMSLMMIGFRERAEVVNEMLRARGSRA